MYAESTFRDPPQFFLFLQAFECMLSGGEKHVKKEKKATELANDNENNRQIEKNNLY